MSLKRHQIVTVKLHGPMRVYGMAVTSSVSAIRETLHAALDVWVDEQFIEREPMIGTARETWLEVSA